MNKIRLGLTESTLLFFFYLDKLQIDNSHYKESQKSLINWLYTTSGFYDKNIQGSYFDFDTNAVKKSSTYHLYFTKLLDIVTTQKDTFIQICFHHIDPRLQSFKEAFLKLVDTKTPPTNLRQFMEGKHILIINNLGSLMKQQYESGNIKKMNTEFPDTVKSIQYFENGYTFFNSGPDKSIIETAKKICDKIQNLSFDGAIISAGAYSSLLYDFIVKNMGKEAFIEGGGLPCYFGVITKRGTIFKNDKINQYWVKVPDHMKPENYQKIEDGCYW